jgi:hypothetical protein
LAGSRNYLRSAINASPAAPGMAKKSRGIIKINLAMIAPGGIGNDAQSVQESLAMRRCFYRCGWKYKRLTETVRPWRPEVGTLPYREKFRNRRRPQPDARRGVERQFAEESPCHATNSGEPVSNIDTQTR